MKGAGSKTGKKYTGDSKHRNDDVIEFSPLEFKLLGAKKRTWLHAIRERSLVICTDIVRSNVVEAVFALDFVRELQVSSQSFEGFFAQQFKLRDECRSSRRTGCTCAVRIHLQV